MVLQTGVPTLYHVDGDTYTEVPIFRFTSYYTNSFSELAIPQNFAMISGNASAKTQAEADSPSNDLEWFCEGSDEREADVAKMPTSTCDQHLQSNLVFPNCVNPDNIAEYDFADDANKCPDGMKQIPQLRYRVLYDTKSVAPDGWSGTAPFQLSCSDVPGDGYCYHGDFINGWFEDAAENMLVTGGGGYEDGQFIAGSHGSSAVEASCTPTDQDPENGTSDYEASLEMMANGGTAVVPADSTTWETATVTAAPTTNMDMSGESVTLATLVSELAPTTATSSSEQCTSDAGGRNRGKCQHNPTSSRTIGQRSKRGAAHYSLH